MAMGPKKAQTKWMERWELTGLGKRRAVLLYELLARGNTSPLGAALFLTRNSRSCPYTASPVTAQSSIDNRPMVLEELERVATARRPEPTGCPPPSRHRRRGRDIGRDLVPREEPDGDTRIVPKHCQRPKSASWPRRKRVQG